VHRRVLVVAVVVVVLVAGALVAWRLLDRESDFERAVGYLPPDSLRVTWIDWSAVREAARGTSLGSDASSGQIEAFLDRAYDKDLTTGSAVVDATAALSSRFGFSPADVAWEVLGQSRTGQVVVLGLGESADPEGIESRLRDLGYDEPAAGPGEGGTWQGGADLVATIDPTLTPVMQNMAVLPDERLVVMSDQAGPVSSAVSVVQGESSGLDAPLTGVVGTPVTAFLWADDFACEDLAMSSADPEDQRVATSLVEEAGGISPLSGLLMAQAADRTVTVGMQFESDEQASDNLQPRVDLASGDAPGQGGTFGERFRVTSGEADGETVVLELAPREGFLLSDITSGPVLLATC
jgi:hypothetical protein